MAVILLLSLIVAPDNVCADSYTAVNYGAANASELNAFNRINAFRADPQNSLYAMFVEQGYGGNQSTFNALLAGKTSYTSNEGWWPSNFGGNLATWSMDFYATVPSTLLSQFNALPAGPLAAFTWSDNIGWSAHQYAVWIEDDAGATGNPHAIPGAPSLGDRFTNAGVNWSSSARENVARNWPLLVDIMHMGFSIDWGPGVDGIQSPPGHRDTMLSSSTHIGIGFYDDPAYGDPGDLTQVQHVTTQNSTDPIFYGYVTDAADEALSGVTVTLYDSGDNSLGSATTDAQGAYTIQYSGGTPDYATYDDAVTLYTSNIALGNSGSNYFLDATIPEPATMSLLAIGGIALLSRRRSR